MKQLFDIYGKFLLEAAIVVTLILLLFAGISDENGNRGMLKMIGAKIPVNSVDYSSYTDYDSYQTESTKEAPVIHLQLQTMIKKGSCKLSDCILAEDYAANPLSIKVISVKAPDDMDITGNCNLETTEIVFEQPGVYTVTVSAKDDANRKRVKVIKIPVNE